METRTRSAIGGVLGLVVSSAFLASPVLDNEPTATGCTQSFSKYAGKVCVPPVSNQTKKDAATVGAGCLMGGVGGTPASIGYGCLGGFVSVLIEHAF